MLARAFSAGALGLTGFTVTIEALAEPGAPMLSILGHDSGPLADSGRRVSAALERLALPPSRQLVLVGPAEQRKDGSGLDLAIACAVLASHGVVPARSLEGLMLWGGLDADGRVLERAGTSSAADTARRFGFRALALAPAAARAAALVPDLGLLPVPDLERLIAYLRGEAELERGPIDGELTATIGNQPTIAELDTDSLESLALEVMLAGGHHLLVHSPLGVRELEPTLAGLLEDLDPADALELAKIHDLKRQRSTSRIRRASAGVLALDLLGGGMPPRPGEVSLAHHGVLVIEDLAALTPGCVSALRPVLVDREVWLGEVRLPARMRLLAVCPRGRSRDAGVLDHCDLVIQQVPAGVRRGAAARIARARQRQRERLAGTLWRSNAEIPRTGEAIAWKCPAVRGCIPSPRERRVARTIADLDLERDPAEPLDEVTLTTARWLTHG